MNSSCTVQDIFHRFYPDYEKSRAISAIQRKAAYHIMSCKTGAFGVNISVCEDCGCVSIHYNSCRDRCCPMCQEFPKEKWVDSRREDVLDAPYFHVVFTVPEELNPVIYSNQKLLYDALYHAASDTLNESRRCQGCSGANILLYLNPFGEMTSWNSMVLLDLTETTMFSRNYWMPAMTRNGCLTVKAIPRCRARDKISW